MLIKNLRLMLRRFNRQKFNTVLHVLGLTLGITVCLLIGIFIRHELSFDGYEKNAARIYRVNTVWTDPGKKTWHYSTPMPLAKTLRASVPGLAHVVMAHPQDNAIIEISPERRFNQDHVLITEPEFLAMFDVQVLKGNGKEALQNPYHALLTETTAKKLYGNEDPLGKTFKYRNNFNITVAGIIRDLPSNSHLPASILLAYVPDEKFLSSGVDAWTYVSGTSTFVELPEKKQISNLNQQLKFLADEKINNANGNPKGSRSDFDVQPLTAIHYDTKYAGGGEWVKAIDTVWLWFFAGIGITVLLLACINFVNLSTAQALTRAKEVGVRKSVGAGKRQLVLQFLAEAWIITLSAGILSLFAARAGIPYMNNLLNEGISISVLQKPGLLISLLAGIFITGMLAGIYPAWIIAKFNPVITLKAGSSSAGDQGKSWLRKSLMVIQFSISAALFIAVLFIAQQVKFMHNKNLGFNKENIVTVNLKDAAKANLFAAELNGIPQIKDYAFSTSNPSAEGHWGTLMSMLNGDDPNRQHVTLIMTDDRFMKMYGLKLLSGRYPEISDTNSLSEKLPEDQQKAKVVVNEKLVQALGLGTVQQAIGKKFWFGMGPNHAEVVGVVNDFNTTSLHDAIAPTLMLIRPQFYSVAGIKISAGSNTPQVIASIKSAWQKAYPDGIFEFKFLDEQIDAFYQTETRLYTLFRIFSLLAMVISCLGLWGLAAYSAQQRTKEIGIRKVLGATVSGIVSMLSKDFLSMVILALIIASPLAWYFVHRWLLNFEFRIDISAWVFILAAMIAIAIALLTVGFQAIKAALSNPVKSLRSE